MRHKIISDQELKEMAERILASRYDCHLRFHRFMEEGYKTHSEHDKKIKHPNLSVFLLALHLCYLPIIKILQKIWQICEPHMTQKNPPQ